MVKKKNQVHCLNRQKTNDSTFLLKLSFLKSKVLYLSKIYLDILLREHFYT